MSDTNPDNLDINVTSVSGEKKPGLLSDTIIYWLFVGCLFIQLVSVILIIISIVRINSILKDVKNSTTVGDTFSLKSERNLFLAGLLMNLISTIFLVIMYVFYLCSLNNKSIKEWAIFSMILVQIGLSIFNIIINSKLKDDVTKDNVKEIENLGLQMAVSLGIFTVLWLVILVIFFFFTKTAKEAKGIVEVGKKLFTKNKEPQSTSLFNNSNIEIQPLRVSNELFASPRTKGSRSRLLHDLSNL